MTMTRADKKYLDKWLAAYELFKESQESARRELPPKTNIAWACIRDDDIEYPTCLININQIVWMDANTNIIVMSNGEVFNVDDESMDKVLRAMGGQI